MRGWTKKIARACADPIDTGLDNAQFEAEYAWLDVPAKRKDKGGTARRRVEVGRTNDGATCTRRA